MRQTKKNGKSNWLLVRLHGMNQLNRNPIINVVCMINAKASLDLDSARRLGFAVAVLN